MGRWSYSDRRVLEYSASITIQDLIYYGIFIKDNIPDVLNYIITTQNRRIYTEKPVYVSQKVYIKDNESYIQFQYDYKGQYKEIIHSIIKQPVNYGGYRYYFKCSSYKNNVYCGQLVKALYFGGNVFACRHCLELVYQNCRYNRDIIRHKYNAKIFKKKSDKLRQYGHPRKANILLKKSFEYETKFEDVFEGEILRRFGG